MRATLYIKELEQDVEFTATLVSINGRTIDYLQSYPFKIIPKDIEIENISWNNEWYSVSENKIIERYIGHAVDKLIDNFHEEMMEINP